MPSHFRCTRCAQLLSVNSWPAGSATPCPHCGAHLNRPDEPATPARDQAWWLDNAPEPTAEARVTTRPTPPPLPAGARHLAHPALAALAAGALLLVGGLLAALALPRGAEPAPEAAEELAQQVEPIDLPVPPAEAAPVEAPAAPAPAPVKKRPVASERPMELAPPAPPVTKPVAPPAEKPAARKIVVKRRAERTEDDLLRQIAGVPELALDRTADRIDSLRMVQAARIAHATNKPADAMLALVEQRPDLAGLPLRKGEACKLTAGTASHLQEGSLALRGLILAAATPSPVAAMLGAAPASRPDPAALHAKLREGAAAHNKWLKAETVPALQQLLMAEHESIREVLVDQLALIDGKQASEALASRALFDLHPRVRERALEALSKRPADEYRDALLKGFEHPWATAAEHAAEAVVALGMKEVVPRLLRFLDIPDPNSPFDKPHQGKWVKEMVRVNHLRNCLLCHAASTKDGDQVRGFVPPTNQPLPPSFSREYYARQQQGIFVRADVTYLKQDFSVPLAVKNPGHWPEQQRFDFLVRERPATPKEVNEARKFNSPTEHQRPVFFALRELTGKDPGPTADDWKRVFVKRDLGLRAIHAGFTSAKALAVDGHRAYVRDRARVHIVEPDGSLDPWLPEFGEITGLALDPKGRLLIARHHPAAVVRVGPAKEAKTLADRHDGKGFNGPRRLVADRAGGVYFTDDAAGDVKVDSGSVYYLSPQGTVSKLPVSLVRPRGVALSPDGKALYVVSASSPEVMAYPVESAGSLGQGKALCRLTASGQAKGAGLDVAVDGVGHVCVLNAATRGLEVISPGGAKLASTELTEAPVACAAGGEGGRTLYVLTATSLLAVDLAPTTH